MNQTIIGQGTYGCVFQPGFNCNSKPTKMKNYITKIQRKESTSTNELHIGKKIKTIPQFSDYFAPILSSCPISLAKIDSDEIKKCDIINEELTYKSNAKYESNKIKYIGKKALDEYIVEKYENNPNNIIYHIISSHNHLLNALQKLISIGIIHFDLKENNIIYNKKTGQPIIIDFGLSLDTSDPEIYDSIKRFGTPYYFAWPIEISFIYIHGKISPDYIITKDILKKNILSFLVNSDTHTLLTESETAAFKKKYTNYYESFIGKPIRDIYTESIKYNMTWDSYSIAWTYLNILKLIFFTLEIEEERINQYRNILVREVTALPHERSMPEKIQEEMHALFQNMSAKEMRKIHRKMISVDNKKEHIEKMKKQVLKFSLKQIETEKEVFSGNQEKKKIIQ